MGVLGGITTMIAEAGSSGAVEVDTLTTAEINEATTAIFDVVTAVLNEIVSNPIFLIFFVSGLVFLGVRIIRSLKRV